MVVAVGSAEEALKRLAEGVHLVVSDFFLPGMNGLALYREAVARFPDLARRFLFLTAGLIQEETQTFLSQANAKLLQKPFTRQQFLGAVREVLG